MPDQPSTWPPPKRKSNAWLIGVGIALFVVAKVAIIFTFVMYTQGLNRMPPRWKEFKDLDALDKSVLQYDSVYGDYLEWRGEEPGSVYLMTRQLVLDESGKFASKFGFHDSTDFMSPPVNIDFSGRWSEAHGVLTLKFYFPPENWSEVFDSLKNDASIRFVDYETIELNIETDTVWMGGIPCVKKQE